MENKTRSRKSVEQSFRNSEAYKRFMITLVTKNRKPVFGKIDGNLLHHSEFAEKTRIAWHQLPIIFPQIQLGEFIFMPDHFHGLVIINVDLRYERTSLAKIVHSFKTTTSRLYYEYGNQIGIRPIGKLWQRNYVETYLPNSKAYLQAANYIRNNPEGPGSSCAPSKKGRGARDHRAHHPRGPGRGPAPSR